MEHQLKANLLGCADAFIASRRLARTTLGRLAAGDWKFFDRLSDTDKSFTARKYDEVMAWLSDNWPDEAEWPAGVERPQKSAVCRARPIR